MDDPMAGANSVESVINIIKQISGDFIKCNPNLRKWISNKKEIKVVVVVVKDIGNNKIKSIKENKFVKILGLQWEPKKYEFKSSNR